MIAGWRRALAGLLLASGAAHGQAIDLAHGGPVTVTAAGGIDWDQNAQTVTAHGDAQAVRGTVTVTADTLIAHYRKKAGVPGAPPAAVPSPTPPPAAGAAPAGNAAPDTGNNEIYRLEANGHVHIFTATDQAWGDHGVYDMDQAVLVLTGHALRLTTPTDVMTARDTMEYWSATRRAVGRGDALVVTNDARRVRADVLVGYIADNAAAAATHPVPAAKNPPVRPGTADALTSSGKLQRVEGYGHVKITTPTEIVTGARGVYLPDTGIARLVGGVHITRGENQLDGAAAIVNVKTGVATLVNAPGSRVAGLVVPNGADGPAANPAASPKPPATRP